ncbi:MAG TPA: D-aminoacylase [Myxococcaceae bacterium]|nr:D-aminoacylase [Myxococcaceae bacterium]
MLALQLVALLATAAPQKLDLIIERGRVVDGSGSAWFRADVGIQGDRIVRMGDLRDVPAKLRLDARDRVVAPGFIDLLGQSELYLLVDPRAESKIRQGITTELTGELGSVAPVDDEILGGVMGWLKQHEVKITWRDLDGYWKVLRAARPAINVATMVSTAQVRAAVVGRGTGEPTPEQRLRMQIEVQKAMRQGAFGVAASLEYPPASYQTTEELLLLARSAAKYGGFYATHLRTEADGVLEAVEEALTIGRGAGVPVEIWHLKVKGTRNWGRMPEVLQRIAAARAQGQDVSANVYPYLAGANMLHADVPGWAQSGGDQKMLALLADRSQRARVEQEIVASWKDGTEPDRIVVLFALSPDAKRYEGKTLTEVAKERATAPAAALVDLVLMDSANTFALRFVASEFDLREALRQPWVSIGVDGSADAPDGPLGPESTHPRAFGSMARLLGTYARDEKLFTLEEAVRKVTSGAARRLGLTDRGLLRPGMMADVVIFDPAKVTDVATYANPKRFPEGIDTVLVNGQPVLVDGIRTEARPGRPLLHPVPDAAR